MPDDHLWTYLVLYFIFLLLSMMFALSYRAVTSALESRVRKSADDGDKRAEVLLSAIGNSSKIERNALYVIFTFNAIATVLAVMGVCPAVIGLMPGITAVGRIVCALLTVAVSSVLIYIFTVVIPTFSAEHDPVSVYSATSWISRPVFLLFSPLAATAQLLGRAVVKLFGVKLGNPEEVTEDEILDMIDASEESGNIEASEKEMLENVFEFSDITAGDVMTHRTDMEAIEVSDGDEEILRIIKETGFSRFPVFEDDIDNVIGVLYTREYLLDRMSGEPTPIRELMHQPLVTPEKVRADVLFRELQKSKIHIAIVLDEYGGTSGLVTMEDLLEEIFGNIYDEFDEHEPVDIQKLDENLWRVAGSVDLETLAETIGCKFDDEVYEDYDTLGGLVFSSLSLIPDDGETPHVQAFGLDINVEVFADRRVEWATVSVIEEDEDAEEEED